MIKRTYRVKTVEKKNVYTTSYYDMPDEGIAAGKRFFIEEMYRWGECIVVTEDEELKAENYSYTSPFSVSSYEVEDQNMDDGCSLEFKFGDDWTDEEKEYVEGIWDSDSYSGFDERGIFMDDCDTEYYGPLEIELLSEEEVEDTPPPKKAWPF